MNRHSFQLQIDSFFFLSTEALSRAPKDAISLEGVYKEGKGNPSLASSNLWCKSHN